MTATTQQSKSTSAPTAQGKTTAASTAQQPVKRTTPSARVAQEQPTTGSRVGSGRLVKVAAKPVQDSEQEEVIAPAVQKKNLALVAQPQLGDAKPSDAEKEVELPSTNTGMLPPQESPEAIAAPSSPKIATAAVSVPAPPAKEETLSFSYGEAGVIVVGSLVLTALLGVLWKVGTLRTQIQATNKALEDFYSKNEVDLKETVARQVEGLATDLNGLKSSQATLETLLNNSKTHEDDLKQVRSIALSAQKAIEVLHPTIKAQVADIRELRNATASANTAANRHQTSVNFLFKEISALQAQHNIGRAEVKAIRKDVASLSTTAGAPCIETVPENTISAISVSPTDNKVRPPAETLEPATPTKNLSPLRTSIRERDSQPQEHVAYAEVRELAQAGLNRNDIASKLNIELAVVDLVLAVANYKENAAAAVA